MVNLCIILLHADKQLLINCLEEIKIFLSERLRLDIHPKKLVFKTYTCGIDYLGYVCFPHHKVLRTKTRQRMFNRVNKKNFSSYNGILHHCCSKKLQAELSKKAKENKFLDE